eukprot:3633457-Rhodomonas_salina.3
MISESVLCTFNLTKRDSLLKGGNDRPEDPDTNEPLRARILRWSLQEIATRFNEFDKDGKGGLDKDQLIHALNEIGQQPTKDELEECFKLVDTDGNGQLDLEELFAFCRDPWQRNILKKELRVAQKSATIASADQRAERIACLARPRRNSMASLSPEQRMDAHLARRKSVSVNLSPAPRTDATLTRRKSVSVSPSPEPRPPHPIFARRMSSEGKAQTERRKSVSRPCSTSGASARLPSLGGALKRVQAVETLVRTSEARPVLPVARSKSCERQDQPVEEERRFRTRGKSIDGVSPSTVAALAEFERIRTRTAI